MKKLNDIHISAVKPLSSPEEIKKEYPLLPELKEQIISQRETIQDILTGKDERFLILTGPCSIHDEKAAFEYAEKLLALREMIEDKIYLVMRVYFEKPRTTIGWRGLLVDPDLDGSYQLEKGIKKARRILYHINKMGLPAGSEILDPIVPQYISDLISWAAIGARTTESQTHREITSGLSMPVGFKNGTDGNLMKAINGISSSRHPHSFIGIDKKGQTCVLQTKGNPYGHLILRGGDNGPNYYAESIEDAEVLMKENNINPAVLIDCSHANSGKDHKKQKRVFNFIADLLSDGKRSIRGMMLESNLFEGNQPIPENKDELLYGVSITDKCISWQETEKLLRSLYKSL